ncbi:MAG: sulfite exporter TauE/SafE family protein [Gammaproteobacteria bacterium]|nr:sulfite exporter TauE/SafE family protein [Gammaproteobacteria bacterium]
MDTPLTISQAFLVGLVSTLHCLGMCGGIMGALSLSLPAEVRNNRVYLVSFVSLFNIGRIVSYMAAGLIAGAFGVEILKAVGLENAHEILRYFGVIFMVAIGFYLAGWFPQMAQVERIGKPVWRYVEPIARKMMPINTPARALFYGMAWGWLPCGLVYVVLLMTVTAGSAIQGANMMLAFGLGTLPTMLSAGIMTTWVRRLASSQKARQVIGVIIILSALASLLIGVGDGLNHQQH